MTDTTPSENTSTSGAQPDTGEEAGVRGGDATERMDSPGEGSGGVPAAGADGSTAAREQLRKDLGERPQDAETETGASLDQAAAIGSTDDQQGGSIQAHGSRPTP